MGQTKPPYDVAVKEGRLDWGPAGPLFDRYGVILTGEVDRRWVRCYERIAASSPEDSRFKLDAAVPSVTFTCRSTDGPAKVMTVLKSLEALLKRVNLAANTRETVVGSVPGGRAAT
jgi:hypothetical protein